MSSVALDWPLTIAEGEGSRGFGDKDGGNVPIFRVGNLRELKTAAGLFGTIIVLLTVVLLGYFSTADLGMPPPPWSSDQLGRKKN